MTMNWWIALKDFVDKMSFARIDRSEMAANENCSLLLDMPYGGFVCLLIVSLFSCVFFQSLLSCDKFVVLIQFS